jgi:hypothetical protein
LRKVGVDMLMFGAIMVFSGYLMRYIINYYVSPEASEISQSNFQKKLKINKEFISEGIYKNKQEIEMEFSILKKLEPKHLKNAYVFFQKNKSYYI